MQKALTTDAISKVCSTLERPAMAVPSKGFTLYKFMNGIWLPALNNGLDASSNDGIPKGGLSQVYVRARAITCPIFRCFVCLCEIVSTNCQPSCISKHPYMHNHASYMLMHLIKLLCCSCTFAFSIPMLIFVKINHVNFKPLLSYQFQTSTVLSTSSPCSRVSQFQFVFAIQFVFVNGQVTSSHPRTACACQFTLVIGQVASSNTRTACTCRFAFILVIGQVASSNTRTTCTCALFLSSAKRLVRIQEQLVPVCFVGILGQVPSSNRKNNLCLSICYLFPQ